MLIDSEKLIMRLQKERAHLEGSIRHFEKDEVMKSIVQGGVGAMGIALEIVEEMASNEQEGK